MVSRDFYFVGRGGAVYFFVDAESQMSMGSWDDLHIIFLTFHCKCMF